MAKRNPPGPVEKAKRILGGQQFFYMTEMEDEAFASKVYARSVNYPLGDSWNYYKQQPAGPLQCLTIFKTPDGNFVVAEFTTHESHFKKPACVTAKISSMPLDEFLIIPPNSPAEQFIRDYVEAPPREKTSELYQKVAAAQHARAASYSTLVPRS